MRRILLIFIIATLLMGVISACASPAPELIEVTVVVEPTTMPIPTEEPKLPIEGVWFTQERGSMLVVTSEYIYVKEMGQPTELGILREVYMRIDGFDLEAETIDGFTTAILSGGRSMGYDSPRRTIEYHLNGTVLEIKGLNLVNDYVLYIFDEFLN